MNEEDQKKYLEEHFYYEIERICDSIEDYIFGKNLNQKTINSLIECFLLHTRNLLEFIYYPPDKKYWRAKDFMDNDKWVTLNKKKPESTNTLIGRINEELSHLSKNRKYGKDNKKWDLEKEFTEVKASIINFFDLLPSNLLSNKLEKIKKRVYSIK